MRDLIRNYKMMLKRRRDSLESDSESQPLLTSISRSSSGSTHDELLFRDSDTTDCETSDRNYIKNSSSLSTSKPLITQQYFQWRPFCYPSQSDTPALDIFTQHESIYDRFQGMAKINGILSNSSSRLYRNFKNEEDAPKTQSSLVTIFSIWNTIMGSSLLAMSWGLGKTGLFPGILLNIFIAGICLYTCHVILKVNQVHGVMNLTNDFNDLCRALIGPWAEILARVFSVIVLTSASIVYWVLMSNFLYNSVQLIYEFSVSKDQDFIRMSPVLCPKDANMTNFTESLKVGNEEPIPISPFFAEIWDLNSTVPVALALLVFPLLNFKSPTFFTKFNSLGTLSAMYILVFVASKALGWGVNMPLDWSVELRLKPSFCALSGMLSLSYFIHNIIISIMKNNRYQENNTRDLSVAFGLVTFTYVFVGAVFYISFPLAKSCIEDNILNNFEKYDTMTVIARLLLLFQLFTVFPLIAYMLRMDVFNNLSNYIDRRIFAEFSYVKIVTVNGVLVAICILFACFLPKIGTLIRYTGALSGLVYIFLLPSLLKLAALKQERRLTFFKKAIHIAIIAFGFVNLACQFFIQDK